MVNTTFVFGTVTLFSSFALTTALGFILATTGHSTFNLAGGTFQVLAVMFVTGAVFTIWGMVKDVN